MALVIRKCLNKSFLRLQVGQVPVRLKREIDGFALNRVQMAIIAESWRLVQVSSVLNPAFFFSLMIIGQLGLEGQLGLD